MLHVVTGADGPPATAVLQVMFEARKRVFVDLLKWDVQVVAGRFEIDRFDSGAATYIVLTDTDGTHRGSARLLDTTQPHLLDSVFPKLCDGAIPRGPTIVEITRFCLDRHLKAADRRVVRNQLVSALADHALRHGITYYTGVAEAAWRHQVRAFGWRCAPLGPLTTVGHARLGALLIEISLETRHLLSSTGIYAPIDMAGREYRHAA